MSDNNAAQDHVALDAQGDSAESSGTLGLCHLIALSGSGSSGMPMDFCSAGNSGSANSSPDLKHSFSRVLKSWSLNRIGFLTEPGGGFCLSVVMLWKNERKTNKKNFPKTSLRSLNTQTRTPSPVSEDPLRAPPWLCQAREGMRSAGVRAALDSGVMTRCQQPLWSRQIYCSSSLRCWVDRKGPKGAIRPQKQLDHCKGLTCH